MLKLEEIERFEDQHRSIFDVYDGFFGRATKPTSTEVRDLLALGLVGGGMTDAEAEKVAEAFLPPELPHLYKVAQVMLGVTFYPDAEDEEIAGQPDEEKPEATPVAPDLVSA